ncbi:hypothetical protein DFH09DRAFT_1271496 [Mycena vulgaris]|nr:hypothetical protein DFH09DRAFT_1271496 [Mycena vulgaris]
MKNCQYRVDGSSGGKVISLGPSIKRLRPSEGLEALGKKIDSRLLSLIYKTLFQCRQYIRLVLILAPRYIIFGHLMKLEQKSIINGESEDGGDDSDVEVSPPTTSYIACAASLKQAHQELKFAGLAPEKRLEYLG